MARLCVVILSYALFGFSSCAPVQNEQVSNLVIKTCPSAEKILPEACSQANVPPECEIVVDYILRLCKRKGFTFELSPNSTWTCPLPLPAIEHAVFQKNPETRAVMDRLVNKTMCVQECSRIGAQFCRGLNDLAVLIKPTATNTQLTTKPENSVPHEPAPDKPEPKETPKVPPQPEKQSPAVPAETEPPPQPPPHKEASPATEKPVPVPNEPSVPEEDPEVVNGADKPEVKPPEPDLDVDLEPEPNLAGAQRPDDYASDDLMETDSKTFKPASKIVNEFAEVSRAIHTNGPFQEAPDSHFFVYFLFFTCISVIGYIAFHNKNKLLALALEGRRGRQGRRRPNSASYRKLDNSLEEAIMSNPSRASNSPVIF